MHLELDAAQRALRDSSRALARSLPTEGHPELADATLAAFRAAGLSLPLAPEPVGRGLSLLDTCLHLEAVAEERPSAAATLAAHGILAAEVLERAAMEPGRWLGLLAADRVGAVGLAEPAGGRSLEALETAAEGADGAWRLRGAKAMVTNGGPAALVVVEAAVPGGEGPGLFLVDGGSPGVEWRGRTPALGLRSVRVADLVLHGVQALARLDRPGQGRAVLDSAVQADRIAIAAQATGLAGGVFQATLRHLQGGTSDGRALPSVGTVQALVADAAAELDAARLLTWNAALRLDAGEDADEASAMACLQASRCARELTDTCLRLWGGEGALDDALPARAVGDARLAVMRGGSEELMRAIVARHLLERLQVAGTLP